MKSTYIKTRPEGVINITELVTLHYYEFADNFIFKGEKHHFWEMVYVDSGAVEIRQDDQTIILKQGEIAFHKPDEFHSIKSHNSSPNVFVVSFVCNSPAMSYFERFSKTLDKSLKPFISSIIKEAESAYVIPKNDTTLKKLVRKNPPRIGAEQLIKTYLEQTLILLIRELTDKKEPTIFPSKESMENHLVSAIKKYLSEHVREQVKIDDLCAEFGYSKTYLCKLFREQSGATVMDYFIKYKIEYVKKLIRDKKYNFTEISDMLSFDNPQYFSRVFKRVTGITPSAFGDTLKID